MEITLQDFNQKEIFIHLEKDYKSNLLNKAIAQSGSQRLLADKLKKQIEDLDIRQSSISSWTRRKSLRLDILNLLCQYTQIPFNQSKILGVKGRTTTKLIKKFNLNINLTKELANLVAKFYCDGSIIPKNSRMSTYNNKSIMLINEFKKNIRKVFGKVPFKTYKNKETAVYSITIPHFLGKILYKKFRLDLDKIPKQIISTDKKIKAS